MRLDDWGGGGTSVIKRFVRERVEWATIGVSFSVDLADKHTHTRTDGRTETDGSVNGWL